LLDIGEERRSIHRAVDDIGCREAIDAQGSDQRQSFPVAVRPSVIMLILLRH